MSPPRTAYVRFQKYIDGGVRVDPALPLVHVATLSDLPSILHSNSIVASTCKVFKERLAYFFYGKPSYVIRKGDEHASKLVPDAAVCFVLRTARLPAPVRVFPFDSGAAHDNRFAKHFPRGYASDDFQMAPSVESTQKFVGAFYGSNRKYFRGEITQQQRIAALDISSQTYVNIVSTPISNDFDGRCDSCEWQFACDIPLTADVVEAVVLPDAVLDDEEIRTHCRDIWRVEPISYFFRMTHLASRTDILYDRVGEHYRRQGYFGDRA